MLNKSKGPFSKYMGSRTSSATCIYKILKYILKERQKKIHLIRGFSKQPERNGNKEDIGNLTKVGYHEWKLTNSWNSIGKKSLQIQ